MKKALPNTKVTVKLRRSNYKEEWYLIIESYPVYKRGSTRASRVVESINPDYIHACLGQIVHCTHPAGWNIQL